MPQIDMSACETAIATTAQINITNMIQHAIYKKC